MGKTKAGYTGGEIRIIGGRFRSRRVRVLNAPGLRPTSDRMRETVFNWLQHDIAGARCLDLFAGSGALGFEAASRGASEVVMVEQDVRIVTHLNSQSKVLGADNVKIIQEDALRYLAQPEKLAFDIIFLDPPFRTPLLGAVMQRLANSVWLCERTRIYVEQEKETAAIDLPPPFAWYKEKLAGQCAYRLAHCEHSL